MIMLLAFGNGLASAGQGDLFRPRISYAYTYDDNLFRLADHEPEPLHGRGDSVQVLGLGFDLNWRQSRQQLILRARANKTRYSNYSYLDYTGENHSGNWNWVLGNHLDGSVGVSRVKTQPSFQDTGPVNNTRIETRAGFNANYRFHSRWETGINLERAERTYEQTALTGSNSETNNVQAGVYYRGGTLERVGLQLRKTEGLFVNRVAGSGAATGYDERALNLVAAWQSSGKARLTARVGFAERDNQGVSGRNYSGPEGRIEVFWQPTGKTLGSLSVFRDLTDSDVINASHEVRTGTNVSMTWLAMPKTNLAGFLTYENRETDGVSRTSDIFGAGVSASHELWQDSSMTVSLQQQWRRSSDRNLEYDATVFGANVLLMF